VTSARVVDGRLLATVDDPEANNPHAVRALVDAGAQIQFVGELRQTLEDVYLALVRGDVGRTAKPSVSDPKPPPEPVEGRHL